MHGEIEQRPQVSQLLICGVGGRLFQTLEQEQSDCLGVNVADLLTDPLLHPPSDNINLVRVMPFGIIGLHMVQTLIDQLQEVHVGWEGQRIRQRRRFRV